MFAAIVGLMVGYWLISRLMAGTPPDAGATGSAGREGASRGSARGSNQQQSHQRQAPPEPESGPDPEAWHVILGVSPNAPAEQIRAAYKSLIRQYHPDKVASLGEDLRTLAERKSKQINAAYQQVQALRGGRF